MKGLFILEDPLAVYRSVLRYWKVRKTWKNKVVREHFWGHKKSGKYFKMLVTQGKSLKKGVKRIKIVVKILILKNGGDFMKGISWASLTKKGGGGSAKHTYTTLLVTNCL